MFEHKAYPSGTFEDAVISGDGGLVTYLVENGLLQDEWGFHGITPKSDSDMVTVLMEHGIEPMDEDVDNCIRDKDLHSAIEFMWGMIVPPLSLPSTFFSRLRGWIPVLKITSRF